MPTDRLKHPPVSDSDIHRAMLEELWEKFYGAHTVTPPKKTLEEIESGTNPDHITY